MLNKDMIAVFLHATNLSESEMPNTLYDMLIACDIEGGRETDINRIARQLTEEHRTGLYRSLLLAWLFDIKNFGPNSWGWYKLHAEDSWHLLPICYTELSKSEHYYFVKGCYYSPDNMIQFLENRNDYLQLLEIFTIACKKFTEEYRPYDHLNIPINDQINFVTVIDEKLRLIDKSINLLR